MVLCKALFKYTFVDVKSFKTIKVMKIKKLIKTTLVIFACVTFQSCATLFTGKTTEVILVNCPNNLKVFENGAELPIEQVQSQSKARGTQVVDLYYAAGVKVNKKSKHHTLTFESDGKKAEVKRNTKVSGGILFLDILFFWGVPIDAITKKWRIIRNRHVDVGAALNGTDPMNQRQLKKLVRKQAKANG